MRIHQKLGQIWPHGELLLKKRKEKGLTLKEVAAELGVGASIISKWEAGSNVPRKRNLAKLAELYGMDMKIFSSGTRQRNLEIKLVITPEQLQKITKGIAKGCVTIRISTDDGDEKKHNEKPRIINAQNEQNSQDEPVPEGMRLMDDFEKH